MNKNNPFLPQVLLSGNIFIQKSEKDTAISGSYNLVSYSLISGIPHLLSAWSTSILGAHGPLHWHCLSWALNSRTQRPPQTTCRVLFSLMLDVTSLAGAVMLLASSHCSRIIVLLNKSSLGTWKSPWHCSILSLPTSAIYRDGLAESSAIIRSSSSLDELSGFSPAKSSVCQWGLHLTLTEGCHPKVCENKSGTICT